MEAGFDLGFLENICRQVLFGTLVFLALYDLPPVVPNDFTKESVESEEFGTVTPLLIGYS